MSGNSTRMGVSLAEGHWLGAIEALGRGANRQPWVLLAEALLLAAAAPCHAFDLPNVAIAAIVLAMGMENAVFQIAAAPASVSPASPARWSRSANSRQRR